MVVAMAGCDTAVLTNGSLEDCLPMCGTGEAATSALLPEEAAEEGLGCGSVD